MYLPVHGGAGYNTAYSAEKLYRDAKIYELYEGTTQVSPIPSLPPLTSLPVFDQSLTSVAR